MSKIHALAGRTPPAAALLILLTSACSDPTTTAPEIPALGRPLAAKNGPNALPTTGRIFFASGVTGNTELYSVNPDGSDLRRLTYTTSREDSPSISSDGRKLIYVKQEAPGGPYELWTSNADGSRQRAILSNAQDVGIIHRPQFSPDGRRVVFGFQESSTLKMRVATMDANGGSFTVLTTGDETGMMPSWSPDGQQLAFWAYTVGANGGQVFTMNADGTNRQQRTNVDLTQSYCCSYAEWSPDGTHILFGSISQTTGEIRVRSLRTSDWGSLPIGPVNGVFGVPSWSPDGTRILYKNNGSLMWMYANGNGVTPVIGMDASGWSWSR